MEGPALGAAAGPGGWFSGVGFWPVCGAVQRRRQHSATTAHRALPVCGWPALGIPWGTARSNAIGAACSRGGGASTGGGGRSEKEVCGGCGFAGLWRFPAEEEAALGNQSAQSPASVWVASPGHAVGHFKVQMQPVQWSAGLVEPALGAATVLCSLLPVLSHSGVLQ